jgi:hypothetical protein
LYIEHLNPIIPESGKSFLSDEFKKVANETDLIQIHTPSYDEGQNATREYPNGQGRL